MATKCDDEDNDDNDSPLFGRPAPIRVSAYIGRLQCLLLLDCAFKCTHCTTRCIAIYRQGAATACSQPRRRARGNVYFILRHHVNSISIVPLISSLTLIYVQLGVDRLEF